MMLLLNSLLHLRRLNFLLKFYFFKDRLNLFELVPEKHFVKSQGIESIEFCSLNSRNISGNLFK